MRFSALYFCLAYCSVLLTVFADRPNVILIMTDDQGYGDLSCHGNPILKTPNLDRLYDESIRLTDFHVSPFCTPTRAALMTGRYPARTGAYRTSSGRTMMHTDERTIAHAFLENGYVTGMVGKWHLGDSAPHRPQDRGFQDVLPTLADLCGIKISIKNSLDGKSFAPNLKDFQTPPHRESLVVQFQGGAYFKEQPKPWGFSCVLKKNWRLMDGKELYDLRKDPSQRNDIAAQYPNIVSEMRALYMPFWESVSPRITPVSIDLGNPAQNPTVLSSQDWYMPTGNPPWNFGAIRKLPRTTGPWTVNVKHGGRYRLTLRQWPKEAGKKVEAVRAKIQIAGQVHESVVEPGVEGVIFEIKLPAGKTELTTWLYDAKGEAGGAYFTEVEVL